uniref:ATP synthase F0 subunit 8 n=1 Tax=Nesophrosyne maritima TaxID=1223861 RepID=UPI002182222D|nr:ATP synthase F0 subunit 8 [Nesophrosyne maritima]UVI59845.1 ATP synthase F0 subunit 8 [Nesophrosyne maritima]
MPQMAPMWWTTMLMTTVSMLLLMIMINYFMSVKSVKQLNTHKYLNSFKWMWY